jgi:hypothetical protein
MRINIHKLILSDSEFDNHLKESFVAIIFINENCVHTLFA